MQSTSLANSNSKRHLISSQVVGVLVLVFVETMFFSALLSSYFVMKKGREIWDAAGAVHLPVLATGFNTLVLLASGISLFFAGKALRNQQDIQSAVTHLFRTIILACCFLAFQIFMGAQLINAGLTMSSSVFGGCYHLMVGTHLLQAVLGVFFMIKLYSKLKSSGQTLQNSLRDEFNALQIFWIFVVGMWPVLYAEIYL